MKIHITENIENIIEGYSMMPIVYGKIDISKYPDNSITEIIAVDALDSIPIDYIDTFFEQICKKMRIGCRTVLGGAELGLVARNIISEKIDSKQFNQLMSNKKSIHSSSNIVNILQKFNLNIDSVIIKGNNYEITSSRSTNKN